MESVAIIEHDGTEQRGCPKCGEVGHVDVLFGYRTLRGEIKAQSWCKRCRGAKTSKQPVEQNPAPTQQGGLVDDLLTADREQVRRVYQREFPKDTNGARRAWRFCVQKLMRRGYTLAPNAVTIWEGK